MDNKIHDLATLTMLRTYSKNNEDWTGIVDRYINFMIKQYPTEKDTIKMYSTAIYDKLCVPSMRLLQNAGAVAEHENVRAYNCAFLAPTSFKDFSDICYLLACGAGVGFSVESFYINQLPQIGKSIEDFFVIEDTKESWSDSFAMILNNPAIVFDYSLIRPAGAPLSSGGTASGTEPLIKSHNKIRGILNEGGRQLTSIEVADIVCLIAEAIISGGSRRSALICLYDQDDVLMKNFKGGNWFEENLHRSKANISAVAVKNSEKSERVIRDALDSSYGEPGLVLKNKKDSNNGGINPCSEVSLRNYGLCNLTEIIASNCTSREDFYYACKVAAFFGTLQAGLTKFNYISPRWAENAKEDALLGVSITGQAQAEHIMKPSILRKGAKIIKKENQNISRRIGINQAKRLTTTKPSGTTSCVMSTTSGVHAAHAERIIRRVRVSKHSALGEKLVSLYGISEDRYGFIQQDVYDKTDIVLQFPCRYENAICRKDENAIKLLNRMKVVYENWVLPGHREGDETNNVSLTVSVKSEEKESVFKWMTANQEFYRGISLLPFDGGDYPQLPFEEVTEEEYSKYLEQYPKLNFNDFNIIADVQTTVACAGGSCEIQ